MKFTRIIYASALAATGMICSSSLAQDANVLNDATATEVISEATSEATPEVAIAKEQVTLDADGNLVGKVFTKTDGVDKPVSAKVTLVKDNGVVLETVTANQDGVFAFQSVDPGAYQMFGATDGYVGEASYDVNSYAPSGCSSCSSCNLGLQSADSISYDQFASAPASACGCAGGGGGAFGGGGLLSNRRLLTLGAVGGIIAIATSGDDDDASPDE